jgi:very-short-patch-repair endonuclease
VVAAILATAPARITVTVPRRLGLRGYPGVGVRRRDLGPADRRRVDGIWCTAAPLTVLETAIALPDGSAFLDRALQTHVRFEDVCQSYCRVVGADGATRIADLLIAAADRADSAAERLMLSILRGAGLTGWERALPFQRWTIDVAFRAAKLAIEIDGWAWHTDVDRFRADRRKGNALVGAGWQLLRFTWHDLVHRREYVVDGDPRRAVRRRSQCMIRNSVRHRPDPAGNAPKIRSQAFRPDVISRPCRGQSGSRCSGC